jgi:2-hydroxy-3-oxopropionate reductase
MLKVGYIGLGLMGKSIARNILKAGFPLVVHNRSRAAVEELAAEGAIPAGSPAEVAGQGTWSLPTCPIHPMWSAWRWARTASLRGRTPG